MRLITLASLRGSPGVTTTAQLLTAALGNAVLIEADQDGGVIAIRHGLGREPGVITFAASNDPDAAEWRAHAQDAGGVPVMVGPDGPAAASALWKSAGRRITHRLAACEGTAILDAGRLRGATAAVTDADLVICVVRPVADQLIGLMHALPALRNDARGDVGLIFVGDGPYRSQDIDGLIDLPVLGELPDDRNAAEAICYGGIGRSVRRSRLARSATALGATILQHVEERVGAHA